MATRFETIVFRVREDGTREVAQRVRGVGTASKKAGGEVEAFKKSLATIGAAIAFAEVVKLTGAIITLADEYTNITNRTRLVTDSQAELESVMAELRQTATDTRSSFAGTAEIFNRVALSAKDLGISNRQVLNLTRSLNQAIILSGASATEASAGLIQFSQGLASGALRGDELRSVLEQLPVVADVIAKELNVTRGELRLLGADGKLTSEIIISAFNSASEELEENFGTTVPTVAQAMENLKTETQGAVGEINSMTKATEGLARAIQFVAENLDLIPNAVTGTLFGALAGRALGNQATNALGFLTPEQRATFERQFNNRPTFDPIRGSSLATGREFGAPVAPGGLPSGSAGAPFLSPSQTRAIIQGARSELGKTLNEKEVVEPLRLANKELREIPVNTAEAAEGLEGMTTGLSRMEEVGVQALRGMTQAFAEFVATGETDILRLGETILATLARVQLELTLLELFPNSKLIQAAFQRQFGGPFGAGDAFLVGEQGPEVVRFPQAGRVDPVPQTGAGQVNIINTFDAGEVVATAIAAGAATDAIVNVIAANPDLVERALGKS